MKTQEDLFGEPNITIPNNEVLSKACNRLLLMGKNNPNITDGESVGEIDRKIFAEVLWEDGLQNLIPSEKKSDFIKIMLKAPESEVITRARRYLTEHDYPNYRLSAKVIRKSEQMRNKIAGSLH